MHIDQNNRVERHWTPIVLQTGAVITGVALIALGYLHMRGKLPLEKLPGCAFLKNVNSWILMGPGIGLIGTVALYQITDSCRKRQSPRPVPIDENRAHKQEVAAEGNSTCPLDTLPDELMIHIFKFLRDRSEPTREEDHLRSLRALRFVNRRFNCIMTDDALWRDFVPFYQKIAPGKLFATHQLLKMNKVLHSSLLSLAEPLHSNLQSSTSLAIETYSDIGRLAIARDDSRIEIRSLNEAWNFVQFAQLPESRFYIEHLAFAPQNKLIAACVRRFFVLDLEGNREIVDIPLGEYWPRSVAVSFQKNVLITSSAPDSGFIDDTGLICFWDLNTYEKIIEINKAAFDLQCDEIYDRVISITNLHGGYQLDFWDYEGNNLKNIPFDHSGEASSLCSGSLKIDAQSKRIVFIDRYSLQVRDLYSGSLKWSVSHWLSCGSYQLDCNKICIDPSNGYIYSVNDDSKRIFVWNIDNGRLITKSSAQQADDYIPNIRTDIVWNPKHEEIIWPRPGWLFGYGGFDFKKLAPLMRQPLP